jgi:hypothetical protein
MSSRARDGADIKAWMKARNDHLHAVRQNANRSGRAASGSASSAGRLTDPRIPAGDLANVVGLAVGAVRGAVHLSQGAAEGGEVAEHLLSPFYVPLHPNVPASFPLQKAALGALHAGKEIALHPAQAFHQANVALVQGASPMAPTVAGEARRRYSIGKNQGELGLNVVAAVAAPETLEARALPVEEQAARWMAKGMTEPQARYMTQPYVGMGSHYYPRGAKLPKTIWGIHLPKSLAGRPMPLPLALSDSPFNVLKPKGISRGDMYERHFKVDRKFNVARLPRHLGKSWNGEALGIQKYGLLGRIVHGAPPALKRTVSGVGAGLGGIAAAGDMDKPR